MLIRLTHPVTPEDTLDQELPIMPVTFNNLNNWKWLPRKKNLKVATTKKDNLNYTTIYVCTTKNHNTGFFFQMLYRFKMAAK